MLKTIDFLQLHPYDLSELLVIGFVVRFIALLLENVSQLLIFVLEALLKWPIEPINRTDVHPGEVVHSGWKEFI
jgi:hypothetical protein